MSLDLGKLDLAGISNSFDTRTNEILSQSKNIDGMFEVISSNLDEIDADFLDDKIFNGSNGDLISKTTLSMDKILNMDESEIKKLLESADSSEEVEEALQKQKQLYAQQVKEFKNLQNELSNLENEMKNLIVQVENAQKDTKAAAQNLEDAQKEEKTAQNSYDKAIKNQDAQAQQAKDTAYDTAMEEYNAQDCPEEEMVAFEKFYNKQLDNIGVSDTKVQNAQNDLSEASLNVSAAQKKYTNENSNLKRLESNLTNVDNQHKTKQEEFTNLSNAIAKTQTEVVSLQTKAADIAFIEQNKEMIKNVAYNKDPEVIATREANGVVFAKTKSGKTNPCAFDLTKMIGCEEMALVSKYKLDLDEVVEKDGLYYPKYFIAKGTHDNKFHIYQRSTSIDLEKYEKNLKHSKGVTEQATDYLAVNIARIYEEDAGWDITSRGNGYMSKGSESDSPDSGYTEIYYLTTDDNLSNCAFGATYKDYRTNSPLSFDLNNDGVKTSNKIIDFDIDADGIMDKINDSADAVLVFDKDGDGIYGEDGSECFGNNTDLNNDGIKDGFKDGFEALKALAKKEGLINDNDAILDEKDLKHLEDTYGLKMKANGYHSEAQSLSDLGITQINLAQTDKTTLIDDFDGHGNQLMTQEGATFIQNGEEKEYADIWHKKNPFK